MCLHLISYFFHINPSQHPRIIFPKHKSYCDISRLKNLPVASQCTQNKHEPVNLTRFLTIIHIHILLLLSSPNPNHLHFLESMLCFLMTNRSKELCASKRVFLYIHYSFSQSRILCSRFYPLANELLYIL